MSDRDCAGCGHPPADHDWTMKLCAADILGPRISNYPNAKPCDKGCMQYTTEGKA